MFPLLRLSWSFADRTAKIGLATSGTLVVASSILMAFAPVAFAHAVDVLELRTGGDSLPVAILLIATYSGTQLLARVIAEFRASTFGVVEQRITQRLGEHVLAHLLALPLRFHIQYRVGDLSQILLSGLMGHRLILQHLSQSVVPIVIELLTILVILNNFMSGEFLLAFLLLVVLCGIVYAVGSARLAGFSKTLNTLTIDAHGLLTDILINTESIKSFGCEDIALHQYRDALERSRDAWQQVYRARRQMTLSAATVFSFCLAVILALAASKTSQQHMSVGDLILVHSYALRIAAPIQMVGAALRDITEGAAQMTRVMALLNEPQEVQPGAELRPTGPAAAITFRDVTFSYLPNELVLKHLTFSIRPGSRVGIVGASGAGKSSLSRLLLRLFEPDSGDILLDDQPIASLSPVSLRRAVAIVPQDTILLHSTIAENIAMGKPGCSQEEISYAAQIAGLEDVIAACPAGYETVVGSRGIRLSGGERQRLAIARAVIRQPRVFIFDEATSSLDTRTERLIMHRLLNATQKTTTLIITHRLSTISNADEILVLANGMIVERGDHAQLMQLGGHYWTLWEAQKRVGQPGPHN